MQTRVYHHLNTQQAGQVASVRSAGTAGCDATWVNLVLTRLLNVDFSSAHPFYWRSCLPQLFSTVYDQRRNGRVAWNIPLIPLPTIHTSNPVDAWGISPMIKSIIYQTCGA